MFSSKAQTRWSLPWGNKQEKMEAAVAERLNLYVSSIPQSPYQSPRRMSSYNRWEWSAQVESLVPELVKTA